MSTRGSAHAQSHVSLEAEKILRRCDMTSASQCRDLVNPQQTWHEMPIQITPQGRALGFGRQLHFWQWCFYAPRLCVCSASSLCAQKRSACAYLATCSYATGCCRLAQPVGCCCTNCFAATLQHVPEQKQLMQYAEP